MRPSLRIIVADDEPDMRAYFSKCLPRLGHTVLAVAENGRDLVEKCRRLKPDLVITDLKMPEMDGIDAAAQICGERPVPVIIVSAHHEPGRIDGTKTNRLLSFLKKPIKQADLAPAILAVMRRTEAAEPSPSVTGRARAEIS